MSVEIGVHLHATYEGAAEKIRAAYGAGCRRFDAAIGGLGGCPFAQDALVGNIATETFDCGVEGAGSGVAGVAAAGWIGGCDGGDFTKVWREGTVVRLLVVGCELSGMLEGLWVTRRFW